MSADVWKFQFNEADTTTILTALKYVLDIATERARIAPTKSVDELCSTICAERVSRIVAEIESIVG